MNHKFSGSAIGYFVASFFTSYNCKCEIVITCSSLTINHTCLQVVYEDLPSNLCAIRDSIEKRVLKNSFEALDQGDSEEKSVSRRNNQSNGYTTTAEGVSDINGRASFRPRPKVPGLQRDIEVLKAEVLKFISEHGQEGFMPMRKQLRMHGRVDIEKAITRMGGFRRIASLMNLSLAYKHRKPKGYWDKFDNLQEEACFSFAFYLLKTFCLLVSHSSCWFKVLCLAWKLWFGLSDSHLN